jgi:hypothetical protein
LIALHLHALLALAAAQSPQGARAALAALPRAGAAELAPASGDWLAGAPARATFAGRGADERELVLGNGLARVTWRVEPAVARVGFEETTGGRAILRAVEPEAVVTIDGERIAVGGLVGDVDRAFLRAADVERLAADPAALACTALAVGAPRERFPWKRVRHCEDRPLASAGARGALRIRVARAAPRSPCACSTRCTTACRSSRSGSRSRTAGSTPFTVDAFECERLAAVESGSSVETPEHWPVPDLTVFSDFAFGGGDLESTNRAARWVEDPRYGTQVNYALKTRCVLVCAPSRGPAAVLAPARRSRPSACSSSRRTRATASAAASPCGARSARSRRGSPRTR